MLSFSPYLKRRDKKTIVNSWNSDRKKRIGVVTVSLNIKKIVSKFRSVKNYYASTSSKRMCILTVDAYRFRQLGLLNKYIS